MTVQLGHQRLAETHYFTLAFAFRIKIRATFPAAHRQCGQGIFQCLLKAEEFEDGEVYGRMEAHTAFERADSRAELHTPCTVYLHLTLIVNPGHAELNYALRLNKAGEQVLIAVLRILFKEWP